jgi:hypothetical protein
MEQAKDGLMNMRPIAEKVMKSMALDDVDSSTLWMVRTAGDSRGKPIGKFMTE